MVETENFSDHSRTCLLFFSDHSRTCLLFFFYSKAERPKERAVLPVRCALCPETPLAHPVSLHTLFTSGLQ